MIKHTEINSDLRGYILIVVALAGMSGILLDSWLPVNPIYSTYWRCYSACLCHFVLARKQMEARLYWSYSGSCLEHGVLQSLHLPVIHNR